MQCYTDLLIGLVLVPEEATINNYEKNEEGGQSITTKP